MNFQTKVIESAAFLAKRAAALASSTATRVRDNAELQDAFGKLKTAGGELRKIARQHGARFVKENASIAKAAGQDLSALTRSVYSKFAGQGAKPAPRARKTAVTRKRASRKAV